MPDQQDARAAHPDVPHYLETVNGRRGTTPVHLPAEDDPDQTRCGNVRQEHTVTRVELEDRGDRDLCNRCTGSAHSKGGNRSHYNALLEAAAGDTAETARGGEA
jgi:hypothetical protein